jgi:hypothetical protein
MVVWTCILAAGAIAQKVALASPGTESVPRAVCESARQTPIAAEVDVVVVGGSTGAVAAAPRHYLGDDMAGTLRLWLEPNETARDPLAKRWLERCVQNDENTLARLAWQSLSTSR